MRIPPSPKARGGEGEGGAIRLLDSEELLRLVLDLVDDSDQFAVALACCAFHRALAARGREEGRCPLYATSLAAIVRGTPQRLAWARAVGCPWSAALAICAAEEGRVDLLRF